MTRVASDATNSRPALALERLSTNGAGQVVYQLKTPYRDGTIHFVFEQIEVLARLAALVLDRAVT